MIAAAAVARKCDELADSRTAEYRSSELFCGADLAADGR
jgi:hypothetical protein